MEKQKNAKEKQEGNAIQKCRNLSYTYYEIVSRQMRAATSVKERQEETDIHNYYWYKTLRLQ